MDNIQHIIRCLSGTGSWGTYFSPMTIISRISRAVITIMYLFEALSLMMMMTIVVMMIIVAMVIDDDDDGNGNQIGGGNGNNYNNGNGNDDDNNKFHRLYHSEEQCSIQPSAV